MRLVSVPGVGRFGIFQWLDGINTMKQVDRLLLDPEPAPAVLGIRPF